MEVTNREYALALDAADPLAKYRSQFVITDENTCYLDGNSLGRLPKATIQAVNDFMVNEWGQEVVAGWAHWVDEAQTVGNLVGRASLGAAEKGSAVGSNISFTSVVTDSIFVNLPFFSRLE